MIIRRKSAFINIFDGYAVFVFYIRPFDGCKSADRWFHSIETRCQKICVSLSYRPCNFPSFSTYRRASRSKYTKILLIWSAYNFTAKFLGTTSFKKHITGGYFWNSPLEVCLKASFSQIFLRVSSQTLLKGNFLFIRNSCFFKDPRMV